MKNRSREVQMTAIVLTVLALTTFSDSFAQRDLPPRKGGTTYSLGMPPVYKGRAGFEMLWYRPQEFSELSGLVDLGVSKDLGSPIVGIAALRLEGYLGVRNQKLDGGGRGLFEIPSFGIGGGVDYNATDSVWDFLLELNFPIRRGGIFGRGTSLAIRWIPARDQTVGLGINMPLWGRNIGESRPKSDNVRLEKRRPRRLELEELNAEFDSTLVDLRERALWLARLTQPFAEYSGADPHKAMAPVIAQLQEHMAATDDRFPQGHTLPAEIEAYHATLDRAFSLAAGGDDVTDLGRSLCAEARAVLLDDILLPYNYLLGQRKKDDHLVGMVAIAQTEYASWVLARAKVSGNTARRVFYVFQTLCDVMEENRRELRDRWEDSRFVWLPLEYALTPDQHDTQAKIDAIIAKATRQSFTPSNRIWYVINEEFQWEMARTVREAEDYHVLWIHDFRGKNGKGKPDEIAYAHTLNYLETFIERVEAFDETGTLPHYFLLLDQHYFEINKSRLFLRLLSAPLDYELGLPGDYKEWEQRLRETQERLREAVANSVLLRIAVSQYGEDWLKNLIKVHVNITNPADYSFWSWHVAGILPVPDNIMRDHRKIAFYDVTEEDPYRGAAMFTGMGIGEHYVGANWEDRAIMIQGPEALAVKDAARGLLVSQGFEPEEIPFPLRPKTKPSDYDARLATEAADYPFEWMHKAGDVLQLHNETGFHDKPINAAKAVLYSLMPAGSVLTIPDSLWQSYIYASLLSGSALRGCKVLIIAPTKDSAPSGAPPTLARAHGLMGRLIVFSSEMQAELAAQRGLLKVGLYAPRQGVGDIAGRFIQAANNVPDWAGEVYPDSPPANAVLENVAALLDTLGYEERYIAGDAEVDKPKIHLKANFFASPTAWNSLLVRPELAGVLREHIAYLAKQASSSPETDRVPDVTDIPEELAERWIELISNLVDDLEPAKRQELMFYLSVGSTNMDYRSMVMDGEVMILLGGWQSLYGFMDFMLIPGLCDWLETTEQLDALLPPPGGMTRSMAGLMKLAL